MQSDAVLTESSPATEGSTCAVPRTSARARRYPPLVPPDPYAPPPLKPAVARPPVVSLALRHPFGRAALTVCGCAVVVAGLGLTIPGVVVVVAACASAGINVRRGFRELAQEPRIDAHSRLGMPVQRGSGPSGGPTVRPSDGVRLLAAVIAAAGSTAAVALLLAFYLPGMVESRRGLDDIVVALAVPAVALALPFGLLTFIRVRLILLIATGVLAWTLIGAARDLFTGPPDGRGGSLIVFAIVIVINLITAVTALVVNATYRAASGGYHRRLVT